MLIDSTITPLLSEYYYLVFIVYTNLPQKKVYRIFSYITNNLKKKMYEITVAYLINMLVYKNRYTTAFSIAYEI